jgi:hypothetical protein
MTTMHKPSSHRSVNELEALDHLNESLPDLGTILRMPDD